MPLKYAAKATAGDFILIEAGTHIGVCDMVVDIGVQPGSDMFPKPKQQVYIRWELPNERIEFEKDGKKQVGPAVTGKTYTASMNEKATLRKHLESWRGKEMTDEEAGEFDVAAILGKPCVISITHSVSAKDGKTYANVTGVGKAMKGSDKIVPEISPIYYGPDDTSKYAQLPKWLQEKIDKQILPEKQQDTEEDSGGGGYRQSDNPEITDDDIPF